jgi:hypothetical protein
MQESRAFGDPVPVLQGRVLVASFMLTADSHVEGWSTRGTLLAVEHCTCPPDIAQSIPAPLTTAMAFRRALISVSVENAPAAIVVVANGTLPFGKAAVALWLTIPPVPVATARAPSAAAWSNSMNPEVFA